MTKKKIKATLEDIIKALGMSNANKKESSDCHAYGEVKSINEDGSYNVSFDGTTTLKCARLVGAKVGDTVFVTIMKNGYAVVTNTVGGDTDASDAQETADEALAAYKIESASTNGLWPVTVGAHTARKVSIEPTVPFGYTTIGVIAITPNVTNSTLVITGYDVDVDGIIWLYVYNVGDSSQTANFTVEYLCTSLSIDS